MNQFPDTNYPLSPVRNRQPFSTPQPHLGLYIQPSPSPSTWCPLIRRSNSTLTRSKWTLLRALANSSFIFYSIAQFKQRLVLAVALLKSPLGTSWRIWSSFQRWRENGLSRAKYPESREMYIFIVIFSVCNGNNLFSKADCIPFL